VSIGMAPSLRIVLAVLAAIFLFLAVRLLQVAFGGA